MNKATESLCQLIKVKKLMEEAINKLGDDEKCDELYETKFTFMVNHADKCNYVDLETSPEMWEIMEQLVEDIGEYLTDEEYYDVDEGMRNRWLVTNRQPYTETEYCYSEEADRTFIMKNLYEPTDESEGDVDDYKLVKSECVGWFHGENCDNPEKFIGMLTAEY